MNGKFTENGWAFTFEKPPEAPWCNVLTNGRYGAIWTDRGGAFAWCGNAVFDRLTQWEQDLVRNAARRSVYLVDGEGRIFSFTPSPCGAKGAWRVTHGIGWTRYECRTPAWQSMLEVVVLPDLDAEIWYVTLRAISGALEGIRFVSWQDLMLGTWSETHREFHRLFVQADRPGDNILVFTKCLDTRPGLEERWNAPFPGAVAHAASGSVIGFETDRLAFLGYGGDPADPAALRSAPREGSLGCWGDPMAALDIAPDVNTGEARGVFVTAFGKTISDACGLADSALSISRDQAGREIRRYWESQVGPLTVASPSWELDVSASVWLRYQVIAARMHGRCGLYQASGAFGFRDQLQDSLIFLPHAPERARHQLELHLGRQYADGSAMHWWHPDTGTGIRADCSDDYLWPILAAAEYYRETGEIGFLDSSVPYLDNPPGPVWDHLRRSLDRAWMRRSERGLPLIGDGDWNDGLSSAGDKGRGESVWVGHFLHGLFHEMAMLARARGENDSAFLEQAEILRQDVNRHGWDGLWYLQGTTDEGKLIGASTCEEGKIHLNPQTWAVIGGTASGEYADRAKIAMKAMREHLLVDWGVLLLAPPYRTPDPEIGYLTRYAPGRRENGGVYTHAAVWAGRAARLVGDAELMRRILLGLLPPVRGQDPRYVVEPYVTPGNMDGPETPTPGRGGWTWYTGSAAWLMRSLLEDLLGIRPEPEGLLFEPAVPPEWEGFRVVRPYRGRLLRIEASRGDAAGICVNGETRHEISGNRLPASLLKGDEIVLRVVYR